MDGTVARYTTTLIMVGYYVLHRGRQTMTELTDNGLDLTDDLTDLGDLRALADGGHLVLVEETGTSVVFADTKGHELNEWANALAVSRSELSDTMHDLARDLSDYDWSVSDPVVVAK